MAYSKERKNNYKIVSVEIPTAMHDVLVEICEEKDFTKSELLRLALKEYILTHKLWG